MQQLYYKLSSVPKSSFLDMDRDNSRSSNTPVMLSISDKDLQYLSSLSQEEMLEEMEEFKEQINSSNQELEYIEDTNYEYVLELVGGEKGMEQLLSFTMNYLDSPGGWDDLYKNLPNELTADQELAYVGMAVSVDNVTRPIYQSLTKIDGPNTNDPVLIGDDALMISKNKSICAMNLGVRLAIAGVGITAEAFLDAIADGSLTELEAYATFADLMGIWYDYEVCRGRWH